MRRKGSVTFWAWIISVTIHLTVLFVLAIFQFSSSKAEKKQNSIPMAKIQQVKKFLQTIPKGPKPKIKRAAYEGTERENKQPLSSGKIFTPVKNDAINFDEFPKPLSSANSFIPGSGFSFSRETSFFGSLTNRRKICYLVDCSGSMSGMFSWVQQQLKQSIQNLEQDQYFRIIFFGNDKIFEFGNGQLVRASNKNKSAALKFIDSIRPWGKSDAFSALRKAVQTPSDTGSAATLIYFLTDGFELAAESNDKSEQKITDLLKDYAPSMQINTIGFWPQDQDLKVLKTIAKKSGGDFVLITDDYKSPSSK